MFTLNHKNPFALPFVRLFEELDGKWVPAVDVEETPEGYAVHVELPGVDPNAIEISIEDEHLKIAGEKKIEERDWRRRERRPGAFERLVPLPGAVDTAKVEAHASNGVLTIVLPKREEARARKIHVDVR